jgi:hypothetical protein
VARKELIAASAAMAAATMNVEQKRRRRRGNVNVRFNVIELFSFWLYMARRPATAGRRVDRGLVYFSLLPEPNSILQCQSRAW